MKSSKKIFIVIIILIILLLPIFFVKSVEVNKLKISESSNVKSNTTVNEKTENFSEDYEKWLELTDEEKENLSVIPRKYDVPLDMVHKRMSQENSIQNYSIHLGADNKSELPASYILIGEDTNKDGVINNNDIKVESYGGINIKVEDQTGSSLCWAFASLNSLETNLALNYNVEYDFSERHFDYLQSDLFKNAYRQQNTGGNFSYLEDYINLEDGPVLETEVPYDSEYSGILDFEYLDGLLQTVKVNEQDFINMPSINKSTTSYTDEELETFRTIVKEHIMENGSIEASIYSQAIINSTDSKKQVLNYQSDHIADHSISIIGWDDNFSKDNFPVSCRPNNDGAYIALNSYGDDWGNCGIFYISYEDILVEKSMNGVSNAYILDVLEIYVEKEPDMINYTSGENFQTQGMIVKAKYKNGEEKEVNGYTISPEVITVNAECITISYTEGNSTKTTTQKINVYDYKENIDDNINIYEDITDEIIVVSGKGNPIINFQKYYSGRIIFEEGVQGISANNSNNLSYIYILDNKFSISDNIVTNDNAIVYCYKNSLAEEYCKTNNINYFAYDNYYKCGKNAYAFLNKAEKTLVISGAGETYEYTLNKIPWKQENEYINIVEIDNGITKISKKLFAENQNIQSVKLGNSVSAIEEYAFYNCTNLSQIELNEGLQNIGKCVFYNCTSLININIPNSVQSMGEYCFYNCVKLSDVKLSSKTTRIETYTFYNCISLNEIELHDNITSFGSRAFMNCTSLKKIKIPKKIYSMNNWTFANCKSLKEVDFSNSEVKQIGDATFNGCSSLESFIMPDSLTNISQGVFGKCTSLKTLQFSHGITRLWSGVAQNCSALEEISLPYGIKIMGDRNLTGGTNLKKVTLPCSLEILGTDNFAFCNNLQYLIIPNSVIISEEVELIGYNTSRPIIYCKSNSNIKDYAVKKGINYEIDDINPTLNVAQENLNNGLNKITITAYDDNEIVGLSDYPYSFDGGQTWQAEPFKTISNNTNITVCARDAVGNISKQEIEVRVTKIEEISIKQGTPNKLTYYMGDELDTTGLVIIAKNINGDIHEVTEGYTYTPKKLSKAGIQEITVNYGGKTTKFNVNVESQVIDKIEIMSKPEKIAYYIGDTLNTTGLILKATYNNGRTAQIKQRYICTPNKLSTAGRQVITVKYASQSTTFDVAVRKIEVSSISVKTKPKIEDYYVGDKIDIKGLVLTGTNNNGSTFEITEGYTYTQETFSEAGTQKVIVEYGGKTTTFDVNVKKVELSSITVKTKPKIEDYYVGDKIDITGLVLTGTNNNGSTFEITEGYTYTQEIFNEAGTQKVTVEYGGKTTTFEVTVIEKFEMNLTEHQIIEENLNNYIENIIPNTRITQLKNNIKTNGTIEVYKDSQIIDDDNTILETGMELRITYNNIKTNYQIVVMGDISGDGLVNSIDLLMLARYKAGFEKEKEKVVGAYLRATDIVKDNKVAEGNDLFKLARILAQLDSF